MAETTNQEEKKDNLVKTGVIIGASVFFGAACIGIGYVLGKNKPTDDEMIIRHLMLKSQLEGEQIMHWVNESGNFADYAIKYLGEAAK
jgi:hypothetical protein